VEVRGKYHQRICDTRVSDQGWRRRHWLSVSQSYARSAHFGDHRERFEALYLEGKEELLSDINLKFIRAVCEILGIRTRLSRSMDYRLPEGKSERLLALCEAVGCNGYLSGPSARGYLDLAGFAQAGIEVQFMDYSGYSEYRQLHGRFEHGVSIIDLVFNEGRQSPRYMKFPRRHD